MQSRMLCAAVAIAAIGLVSACEAQPPTSTVAHSDASDVAAPSPDVPKGALVAKREARQIIVQAGQSVSRIAAQYDIPQRTIIAANDLTPPYKIKIGQQLRIPSANKPPPAPAAAESPPTDVIPLDGPALVRSSKPPSTTVTASPLPVEPAVKPLAMAAPADDKSVKPPPAPVVPAPTKTSAPPSGIPELPASPTTAVAPSPTPVPAPAPPGVTCPSGTTGMWSEDIIKKPVYICHRLGSPS